jgi:hypothetical protein
MFVGRFANGPYILWVLVLLGVGVTGSRDKKRDP